MQTIGVRALRARTTQILKAVSEQRETIRVTHHGKVLAHLVPPPQPPSPEVIAQAIEQAHQLMAAIADHVPASTDAATLMQAERE
ncbi:MAG: type II toxin-antitoxin system Phd/YefM family antitoxin [Chloroflexi bacterium]|nr:type II toxin-antitoxin system Phd/YefM family antitoxin [Chloroflexota bacterium]